MQTFSSGCTLAPSALSGFYFLVGQQTSCNAYTLTLNQDPNFLPGNSFVVMSPTAGKSVVLSSSAYPQLNGLSLPGWNEYTITLPWTGDPGGMYVSSAPNVNTS